MITFSPIFRTTKFTYLANQNVNAWKDFLYIRNFEPSRWPAGNPYHKEGGNPLQGQARARDISLVHYTFPDMDAGPTRTWLILNGEEPQWLPYWNYAFDKRPGEELYDLRKDPDYLVNVAEQPEYDTIRKELSDRLMKILTLTGDPRVTGEGQTYEKPPFAGPGTIEGQQN